MAGHRRADPNDGLPFELSPSDKLRIARVMIAQAEKKRSGLTAARKASDDATAAARLMAQAIQDDVHATRH
jgi:hypothetical protein